MALAASTTREPCAVSRVTLVEPGVSQRLYSTPVMRPVSLSISSFDATDCVRMSTCGLRASIAIVFSAVYFACTGQIGMHTELPWQRCPSSRARAGGAAAGPAPGGGGAGGGE